MLLLVRKRVSQALTLLLLLATGPALGGGGDWKMGPFGPYWDDNSWPEFTPMYWMEEFMNRLDDDDDEIQTWMLRNQFPGQYPGTGQQGFYPQDAWQPDGWTGSRAQSIGRVNSAPRDRAPGGNTYIIGDNHPAQDAPESEQGPLPYLTPEEFARMPIELQREYKHAFDREYQIVSKPQSAPERRSARRAERSPLPNLTREEFARMPAQMQREYKRAFDREYSNASRRVPQSAQASRPSRERQPLPNLTPEEFASMPAELQREYERAFDREHSNASRRVPQSARASRSSRERQTLPNLTPEEFMSMPPELQREYERAFNQEHAQYLARKRTAKQLRRDAAPTRRSRAGVNP